MLISYSRNFVAIVLLAFVSVIVLCAYSAIMVDKPMSNNLLHENGFSLCNITPQGHVSAWQNFLNVIPQKTIDLLLLALLLVFVAAKYKNIWSRAPEIVKSLLARNCVTLDIIDPIKRALARGIIQSKIYPSYIG